MGMLKMRENLLTDNYYFDTDCLSAFLWVREESLLAKLYPGRIVLPMQVYNELKKVPHLLSRIDTMKKNGDIIIESIMTGTQEFDDYRSMAVSPPKGEKIIGKGEAAAISLAKKNNGTLASNNLRDIKLYVDRYSLKHITTGDILIEALHKGYITEKEGNVLWEDMLKKKRMLPTQTFTDFLKKK
jgi:predicted nucleic acid-binding protein